MKPSQLKFTTLFICGLFLVSNTIALEKGSGKNTFTDDMDYLTKEGKTLKEYPTDLESTTLLVLDQYSEIKMGGLDKMGKEMFGKFGDKYKFKYEIAGNSDFLTKAKSGKYKYALLMKLGDVYEKTKTTKKEGAGGVTEYKTKTTTVGDVFFMIKDLTTMDIYVGSNEELVDTQKPKPQAALKEALKALEKHYGWK